MNLVARQAEREPCGAGRPPPFAMLDCRHRDRTVYVTYGLFGRYLIRLCARPEAGSDGWHGHGDIIAERTEENGVAALTLVVALAEAADPDALLRDDGLADHAH